METPCILEMEVHRVSSKEAEKIVDECLSALGVKLQKGDKHKQIITIKNDENSPASKFIYHELISLTRNDGICNVLQVYINKKDLIFGNSGVGLTTLNSEIKVESEFAGYKKELIGPLRTIPIEVELSKDIDFYRNETCLESNSYDFELCFRNYRAYLMSCITLVDAYINKHILVSNFREVSDEVFLKLKESRVTEERLDLFLQFYCNSNLKNVKNTDELDQFKKLKRLRNEIVHTSAPFMDISLKALPNNLNYSKKGIGGLLKLLQILQGKNTLSFIENIRTAPNVYFNKVILKENGSYEVKRIFK